MSRTVNQQMYTTQQPDGTVVTTTTRVRNKYVEDEEYGCGPGTINQGYCLKPEGILRLLEILFGLIIICLVTSVFGPGPFKGILFGQTLLLVFDSIAFTVTFIFVVVYFFNLHVTHLKFWPWSITDFVVSIVAAIFFFILGIIESYYATGAWSNNCNDIGGDGVIHNGCRIIWEWVFAAIFCFVNAVLYAVSAVIARRERHYDPRHYDR
ncbi:Protein K04G2.9 [Aphelenchoides avenae]|nr:Protein K04G2.9 [Aphelenchus avenae]